jgi:transcriptional regulator with XRE-family HTH domain
MLGEFIRDRREQKGYSVRKLAHAVGISPTMMSKMERDAHGFKAGGETLKRIADILDVNTDFMLSLAGKIDSDVLNAIIAEPLLMPDIIRGFSKLKHHYLKEVAVLLKENVK